MYGLNTAAIYVVQTLGSLYLLIMLLRFVLQLVRADFYNPLCQFIVRATQPLLKPVRRIIPSLFGLDMSSLLLAIVIQMIIMALTLLLAYGTTGNPLQLLVWSIIGVTALFLKIFFFAMIISVILSWVAPPSWSTRSASPLWRRFGASCPTWAAWTSRRSWPSWCSSCWTCWSSTTWP
jgi:YggT family protein